MIVQIQNDSSLDMLVYNHCPEQKQRFKEPFDSYTTIYIYVTCVYIYNNIYVIIYMIIYIYI